MPETINEKLEVVALDAIKPHPQNPRRGDVGVIKESILANGFYGAVVVQRSTGFILAGNHRYEAAREAGMLDVPAIYVDADDPTALRILLADNRTNDLASYDDKLLAELLGDMDDLQGTGYDAEALAELLAALRKQGTAGKTDPDDVPEVPVDPIAAVGDLWLLGEHRVVCGDSTDYETWKRLPDDKAVVIWTDPPYGVDYTGKTKDALKIANDTAGPLKALLGEAWVQAQDAVAPGSPFYIASPAGRQWADIYVLDPFLGSGSTLIACEKTGRRCYGLEIDPVYVDVIVKRWEDFTGQKAKKGKP